MSFKVAENAPKGGNFGPARDKFLERQKEKKVTVDQPLLYPKYDYIKSSKGSTILKGPVEKKKLEALKKQREDFEQKNYETKMAMLKNQK